MTFTTRGKLSQQQRGHFGIELVGILSRHFLMGTGILSQEADHLLRKWLRESGLNPGSRLPSERQLSKQIGVSHFVANRAMTRLITEGVVEREGYKLYLARKKPSPSDRASCSCDLVVSGYSVHRPRYRKIARELGITLRMHAWMSTEEAVAILKGLAKPQTESVIFDAPHGQSALIWQPALAHLTRKGIPVVCIGQPADEAYSIVSDTPRAIALTVQHLLELGHRQIAMATMAPRAPLALEAMEEWASLCQKHDLPKSIDRIFLPANLHILPEDSAVLAKKLAKEWNEVTALVIFSGVEFSVQYLLDQLARLGRKVPQRLSIVSVDDTPSLSTSTPSITTTTLDVSLMHETAFHLAQRAIRKKAAGGVLPKHYSLRLQPLLAVRQSTQALLSAQKKITSGGKTAEKESSQITWVQFMGSVQDTNACLRRPYPEAMKAPESRFRQIDLSLFVNRPLNYRRGWLGDMPLKCLPPGRHWIHGVPFDVLGGPDRTDRGAVVFHSAINSTGMGQKLPSRLAIPIGAKVAGVYILHGCANARYLQPFATYGFYQKKKELASIPMVSLGQPPSNLESHLLTEACQRSNIQDWWPDFPHLDFPGARMAPIIDSDRRERVQRHVYLYTLEWINPKPDRMLTHIEITADTTQSTTLGLLSICLLLPKEAGPK